MTIVFGTLAALVAGLYLFRRRGNSQFWKLVACNGDFAYDWLMAESCWRVHDPAVDAPIAQEKLVGYTLGFPIYVPKLGRMVKAYCVRDALADSEHRFIAAVFRRRDTANDKTQKVLHLSRLLAADRSDAPTHLWEHLPPLPEGKAYMEARQAALPELVALCEADVECNAVLRQYALERQQVIALYRQLNSLAPGWVGAMYVPVLVLVYPRLLVQALRLLAQNRPQDLRAKLLQTLKQTPWSKSGQQGETLTERQVPIQPV